MNASMAYQTASFSPVFYKTSLLQLFKYFSWAIFFFSVGYFGTFTITILYNIMFPQPIPLFSANAQSLKPNKGTAVLQMKNGTEVKSQFVTVPSSGGKTGGAFIEIDSKIEKIVSGKNVTIEIEVSSVGNKLFHQFAVAYSTNAIGNSGWRKFPIIRGKNKYRFEYLVPKDPNAGKKYDYVGILSDFSGIGTTITFNSLNVYLK